MEAGRVVTRKDVPHCYPCYRSRGVPVVEEFDTSRTGNEGWRVPRAACRFYLWVLDCCHPEGVINAVWGMGERRRNVRIGWSVGHITLAPCLSPRVLRVLYRGVPHHLLH